MSVLEQKKRLLNDLLIKKSVLIMGVLNVTPDSFSDGGKYIEPGRAVAHAKAMIKEGADIIDIGGESTRPYAAPVSLEEEKRRVLPVVHTLSQETDVLLSIDTTKAPVAYDALEAGADMVNDISALTFDNEMASTIAYFKAGVVLMHMQGTPQTMQDRPRYKNIIEEIKTVFTERIRYAEKAGIAPEQIVIDPGLGFGKTADDNLTLIRELDRFKTLKKPVLIGISRKSFVGKVLNLDNPQDRIFGTAAAVTIAVLNGARIIRVHDVQAMRQVVQMTEAIERGARR